MTVSTEIKPLDNDKVVLFKRSYLDLFLISFVILFFELTCIRWFGSTVVFLTFFTNVVLIACFLGMSVGCLTAARERNYIVSVIPLTLISVALAYFLLKAYEGFEHLAIGIGNQPAAQLVYFGTDNRYKDPTLFVIPIWLVMGIFFALISLMFIGLGQTLGRAFDTIPNRIAAYTVNIFGSLSGIILFSLASFFQTPPYVWFAVCILICFYFVKRFAWVQAIGAILILFLVSFPSARQSFASLSKSNPAPKNEEREQWSPYYKITYDIGARRISTNNISHQIMLPMLDDGSAYDLPFLLTRDAGSKPFKDILIIGAGSGNDVAVALVYGNSDTHVDAVEIDPVILSIGKAAHPDKPYEDKRVTYYLDDGRNFLKKNENKKYDLIVYALVDSLVLHSGYSSLRLESFLFTKNAFENIKNRLKPDGLFVMYNWYRQGWIVGRLVKMAEEAFGAEPMVFSLPFHEKVDVSGPAAFFAMIMVGDGRNNAHVQAIRQRFQGENFFWMNSIPKLNYNINGYSPMPPNAPGDWSQVGPAKIDATKINLVPGDNWPFLYLRNRIIPLRPTLEGMAIMAAISVVILLIFAPARSIRPNWQMFFLGAGFMLLETKSVVHMALLFGSTWIANSIVFAAILVMILLANLFVLTLKPRNLVPYYCLLVGALLLNTLVPMTYFLSLPESIRPIVSCVVVFMPILFAGIIFSSAFGVSRQPDVDMGSNIGGVILGGLCENFSLMLGFNYLLVIAMAFYVLSLILKPQE